ncbi:MAG: MFS transporter, partial [Rikenellaceae bacterium]
MRKILPVLFGFFVMGFCDVVGIATSYVKADFGLSESLAGLIPSAVFMWFLLLSVPTALLMNKIGRKKTVQLSNVVTFFGMMIPFFVYTFESAMVAFALLGIGNTMLQVSLNPLLTNVVKGDSLTSSLTAGQVVKAISSFAGPFIALFATVQLGNWQYLFPIFAAITLLATIWLMMTPIEEEQAEVSTSSIGGTFSLLSDTNILLCVLGIMAVVGLDVGMNTVTPKLLMERAGMDLTQAS